MHSATPWTPPKVAEALVRAFRRLPGHPVMSSARGFSIDVGGSVARFAEVEAFAWPERFIGDPHRRRVLMTWARCTAAGASVSELYRDLRWPRSTAERHRAAALAAIARGLNSGSGVTGA